VANQCLVVSLLDEVEILVAGVLNSCRKLNCLNGFLSVGCMSGKLHPAPSPENNEPTAHGGN